MKYLDENGLIYLWSKIKAALANKSDTGHTHPDASTTQKGMVQLTDALSDSTSLAPTVRLVNVLKSTVTNLQALVTGMAPKSTTLSGYGITDAYTKTEVDSKLTSAVRYKGTVASYSALPSGGQSVGDMYNITAADATNGVKAGDNVVWNGSGWDVQSGTVDMSGYILATDTITNAEIDEIVAS